MVVHIICRCVAGFDFADEDGWDSGDGSPRGNGFEDNASGTDFRAFSYFDISEYFGSRADKNTAPHFGVPISAFFAGASEGDCVQNGDVIVYLSRFSNDKSGGVIEQNTAAERGGGMNIHGKYF
jgi:hypothetical protein